MRESKWIDGGQVNVPEFGYANADGQWSVEGVGVVPDIEVENDAKSLLAGRDPQLERAFEEVLPVLEEADRAREELAERFEDLEELEDEGDGGHPEEEEAVPEVLEWPEGTRQRKDCISYLPKPQEE